MSPLLRNQQLARSQAEALKFSGGIVLTALFLYYGRNLVRFGIDVPIWHLVIMVLSVVGCLTITLLAYENKVSERYGQLAGATIALLHGLATLSNTMAGLNPGVYSTCLSVLVFGIAVLSERVFALSLIVYLGTWAVVMVTTQPAVDFISMTAFVIVSTIVSALILNNRIEEKLTSLRMLDRIDELESFLSLCANCRKVRDAGEWVTLETYMKNREGKTVSHGICPKCTESLYGDSFRENQDRIAKLAAEQVD
jgi:hypothetical protein